MALVNQQAALRRWSQRCEQHFQQIDGGPEYETTIYVGFIFASSKT